MDTALTEVCVSTILASPLFEWSLGFTMLMSLFWMILRRLICLPYIFVPCDFTEKMGCATNRRLVRTKKGYLGLAGDVVRVGDLVVLCEGGKLPLVVRKAGQMQKLVGDCYIHGIMYGEAFEETKCQRMWIV